MAITKEIILEELKNKLNEQKEVIDITVPPVYNADGTVTYTKKIITKYEDIMQGNTKDLIESLAEALVITIKNEGLDAASIKAKDITIE